MQNITSLIFKKIVLVLIFQCLFLTSNAQLNVSPVSKNPRDIFLKEVMQCQTEIESQILNKNWDEVDDLIRLMRKKSLAISSSYYLGKSYLYQAQANQIQSNDTLALMCAYSAYSIFIKQNAYVEISESRLIEAQILMKRHYFHESYSILKEIDSLHDLVQFRFNLLQLYQGLSRSAVEMGYFQEAIPYLLKYRQLSIINQAWSEKMDALDLLARAHRSLGNMPAAQQFEMEKINYLVRQKQQQKVQNVFFQLAKDYFQVKAYTKSLESLKLVDSKRLNANDIFEYWQLQAQNLNALNSFKLQEKALLESLKYARQSCDLLVVFMELEDFYHKTKKARKAKYYRKLCLQNTHCEDLELQFKLAEKELEQTHPVFQRRKYIKKKITLDHLRKRLTMQQLSEEKMENESRQKFVQQRDVFLNFYRNTDL